MVLVVVMVFLLVVAGGPTLTFSGSTPNLALHFVASV